MGALTAPWGSRAQLAGYTALNSLANATYASLGVITTNNALDVVVEVTANPNGTVASNKRLRVFARVSWDNAAFSSGPTSGTTTTDEPNLKLLGDVQLLTNSAPRMDAFSVAAALGYVPPYVEIVVKNECNVSLNSTGNDCRWNPLNGNAA